MTDLRAPCPPFPHQPLYKGDDGVVHFKRNAIVACLLKHHPLSLNEVLGQTFERQTKAQFLQLLGVSFARLAELGFADDFADDFGAHKRLRRRTAANAKHPIQPLDLDGAQVLRFKQNDIVCMLLDTGPKDLNSLAVMGHPKEDWEQLAQLIGYSHSGSGDLSYISDRVYNASWGEWETREVLFRQAQLDAHLPGSSVPAPCGPRL